MAQRIVDHSVSLEDIEKEEKLKKEQKSDKKSEVVKSASPSPQKKLKKKKKHGKKYAEGKKKIDKNKSYSIEDAIKQIRKASYAKFNETVEMHINLGIDPQNSDQRIRFITTLPHGIGKELVVLVISKNNSGKKGNILYRDISVVEEIIKGKLQPDKDFDMVIAVPDAMKDIAKAARILGPKGMMPSLKTNTVTSNLEKAVKNFSKGQIEVKSQPKHAVIHQSIGKLDFEDKQLVENAKHLLEELNKHNPSKMKKKLIQKIFVSTTMSPSIRVEI